MSFRYSEACDKVFEAILTLETVEECYRFFDDILTVTEIQSMAQRFEVARELDEKRVYQEISRRTGASSATISRVNRCLQYGSGGYRLVLDRLKGLQDKIQDKNQDKDLSAQGE